MMNSDSTASDRLVTRLVIVPGLLPAASYLLLKPFPVAYAASLWVFVATPIVFGAALGWQQSDRPARFHMSLAPIYGLASVFVAELAEGLVPLLSYNLFNLPAYTILATTLFAVAALVVRAVRPSRQPRAVAST